MISQILIPLALVSFLCLFGMLIVSIPIIFIIVFLGGAARRRQRDQRMDNMLDQQYLMMYLQNQQKLESLNSPNKPNRP